MYGTFGSLDGTAWTALPGRHCLDGTALRGRTRFQAVPPGGSDFGPASGRTGTITKAQANGITNAITQQTRAHWADGYGMYGTHTWNGYGMHGTQTGMMDGGNMGMT